MVETMEGGALNIGASKDGTPDASQNDQKSISLHQSQVSEDLKNDNIEFEEGKIGMLDSESEEEMADLIQGEPEDLHNPKKIILQRQFFEAVVRAASVGFAN